MTTAGPTYTVRAETRGDGTSVDLLHRNLTRHGTIYNTLAAVCDVPGEILAIPTHS